jgi:hypothetical protein
VKPLNQPHELYLTTEFRALRSDLMNRRTNSAGFLLCEECGKPILKKYDCIAHHHIPVTTLNMNDASITLNPDNIKLVHLDCHNRFHARFGHNGRKVYIVHGAPLSGKTLYVNTHKGNSDLIVDIDNIWECITGSDRYVKPNALKQDMFAVRDCLLDCVKRRIGSWETAWIIESLPFRTPREERARQCGGELIHIDTDKETCLNRLYVDDSRPKEQWTKYINDYFVSFQE